MRNLAIFLSIMLIVSTSSSLVLAESISPKAQMKSGTMLHQIQCKSGYDLILKASTLSPACVKPSSVAKLMSIGWAASAEIKMSKLTESENSPAAQRIKVEEEMKMGSSTAMGTDEKTLIGNIDITHAAPVEGSLDAPITIVEFGDFQCPKCDQWFLNEKPTIQSEYIEQGKVKFYFLDFTFLGDDSDAAANASYCADDQDAYWDYHSHLYNNQGGINDGWASIPSLKAYAISIGLNSNEFSNCVDSNKHADRISYNENVGKSKGVAGTPTFFIIGPDGQSERIDGPQPSSVFATVIESMIPAESEGKKYTVELEESVSGTSP